MTREEADNILLKAVVGKYPTTYNGADVIQVLLEVFNDKKELEAQIKAKENDLERQDMIIKCLNIDLDNKEKLLKAKDEEIEKLKSIIEEAIRKPMGVEPHSWSDYKMQKDNS